MCHAHPPEDQVIEVLVPPLQVVLHHLESISHQHEHRVRKIGLLGDPWRVDQLNVQVPVLTPEIQPNPRQHEHLALLGDLWKVDQLYVQVHIS